MSEIAMPQVDNARSGTALRRSEVIRGFASSDSFFRRLTQSAAVVVLLILGGVIASLIQGSIPAFREFGFGFFTSEVWNPVTENLAPPRRFSELWSHPPLPWLSQCPSELG